MQRQRERDQERFDEVLVNMAGQCGGIEPLFDTIFSFLYRKTDYFHVMQEGDKMGFPKGVARQILGRSFGKFETMAAAAVEEKRLEEIEPPKPKAEPKPKAAKAAAKPAAAAAKPDATTKQDATATKPAAAAADPDTGEPAAAAASAGEGGSDSGKSVVMRKGGGAEVQVAPTTKSHLVADEDVPYNGGRCANYHWEQTIADVTVNVPVPAGTRARDVVCVISKSHLTVKLKGQEKAMVDGEYPCDARNGKEIWEKVKVAESYWNVGEVGGELCVTVYLEKERESWWKSALDGHSEIDTTKVDSTRDMWDYDDETQGAIRKIMFDQHQKRLGKPTSDEITNHDMLKAAWDAEGSPFKGTPFDPSKVNFGGANDGASSAGGLPGMPPMPPGMGPPPVD